METNALSEHRNFSRFKAVSQSRYKIMKMEDIKKQRD